MIKLEASGLCGDFIGATAFLPSEEATHLVFWNWKTGECKVDAVSVLNIKVDIFLMNPKKPLPLPIPELGLKPTFSFLDRHHILAGFLRSRPKERFRERESQPGELPPCEPQPRELLVCAVDPQRLHDPHPDAPMINDVHTYRFRIPKTLKPRELWEIHTHRNSLPLLSPAELDDPQQHGQHYFDYNPTDQLVVVDMASRLINPLAGKPDPVMSLFIPARALLRHITRSLPAAAPAPGTVFSWEQWGEGRAMLTKRLDTERRLPHISRVSGLRHVARKPVARPAGLPALFHVVDFHNRRAARIVQNRPPDAPPLVGMAGTRVSPHVPVHATVEVPLPREMQDVDPLLISTSICQDALLVFEVSSAFFFWVWFFWR